MTDSAYIFRRNGQTWEPEGKLVADDDTGTLERFGTSVAISGDTAIVGASDAAESGVACGAAYVFERNGDTWDQQDKLVPGDGAPGDLFGVSVDISDDTAIVGARQDDDKGDVSGSAYIFRREGVSWFQQTKLVAPDGAEHDYLGISVAISGDTAIVGANGDDDQGEASGSAYIFTAPEFSGLQSLTMDPAGNHLYAIAPEENALVVLDATDLSVRQALVPAQVKPKLVANDGSAGDEFGRSVAIFGDTAIVGAYGDDDEGNESGSAYIFRREGDNWIQQTQLLAGDGAAGNHFGESVAISGDTVIVGASGDDDKGTNSGSAYVFRRDDSEWGQPIKLTAVDGAAFDYFGESVAISGDTVIVGASLDDDKGTNSGSAYVFRWNGDSWVQQTKLLAGDGAEGDYFGASVAISGDTVVVGAEL